MFFATIGKLEELKEDEKMRKPPAWILILGLLALVPAARAQDNT
jgi:hypothetical protein